MQTAIKLPPTKEERIQKTSRNYNELYMLALAGEAITVFMNYEDGENGEMGRDADITDGLGFELTSTLFFSKDEYIEFCEVTDLAFVVPQW